MKRGVLSPLIKLVVFLVVTGFATYVLGVTIANTSYGGTTTYKADFTDASGVQVGDDVRVAGVRVGSVKGIKLVRRNVAEVTFSVVKERPLPSSVIARLRYRNLVGQRYLDIEQGAGNSNRTLAADMVIPVSQTQPAIDLTALFDGFQPLFQGLNAGQINQLSGEIIDVLQGEGGSLELLLSTVADLTNSLADHDQLIGDVIDNLNSVLTAVGDRDTELSDLIVQLQRFISGLAQDRQSIGNSIDGINSLTTSVAGLLGKAREPLRNDITALTGLVGNLNAGSSDLQYVIQNLAPTLGGLIKVTSYGSFLNFYLCSVSGTIKLPGDTQTLHLDQVPDSSAARCKS
ncbi:MAG TPA: MCE family protein [Jatrophihabitans sp.]|jgi:phospholipid/cholesterol/gamma-HCH transport system substrate-binding protein